MSRYRFVPDPQQNDKKITVRLMSGEEITLGIEPRDTVGKLKEYIWKNKFGDLRAGYVRMKITMMTDMANTNYVELVNDLNLYNDTPPEDSVISLIVVGEVEIGPHEDLRGEYFRGAVLTDADLRGAVLINADLTNADLRGAVLREAYLSEAELRYANLTDAYLTDADLIGADLRGAKLRGADLSGVDLSVAKNVPKF